MPEPVHPCAIVQARMSSQRLPGKVLMGVAGMPMIELLVRRLTRSKRLNSVVIATSTEQSDDPIAKWAKRFGLACVRGDLNNVAARFRTALEQVPSATHFVRVCADSPFYDPQIVDQGIDLSQETGAEIVSNTIRRTFPKGVSVEVVKAEFYKAIVPQIVESEDCEHVTRFFYRNKGQWRLHSFELQNEDYSALSLCVDTQDEYSRAQRIAAVFGDRVIRASWREIAAVAKEFQ